ncbi:MAG: LCP family protein [Acidobacteria bacterium]|nr:LCP family protein [Acidobacteriota bacterium]
MSRDTELFQGLRQLQQSEAPRRRSPARTVLAIGVVLAVVVAGAAGALWLHIQSKFEETHRANILVDPLSPGEPMNVLVLGSDRRDVVDPKDRSKRQFKGGAGQRADTIILVHVSGDRKRAVLVHFPRDLRVSIPGKGIGKINGAYSGGPNLMMRTIREFSGLSIHHYVEVNYASFENVVNAVGGVRVCVDRAYHDRRSGLEIPRPGCSEFDGDMALSYVRARYVDPDGDFGRIRRQQQFMRVLMSKVTSVGFLLDIPRVMRLSSAVAKGVVTDQNLTLGIVRQIANRLAGFRQRSVDFRIVPSFPRYVHGVSYVIAREAEARALFAAIRADEVKLPPYGKTALSVPDPPDVTVTILNGTKTKGLAGREAERLRAAGFVVRRIGDAPSRSYRRTQILFRPNAELKAKLVEDEFPGAQVKVSTKRLESDVVVVVGTDAASRAAARATASP